MTTVRIYIERPGADSLFHATTIDGCTSSADGLAFYLRSRNIEDASERSIKAAHGLNDDHVTDWRHARLVREHRHPITGALEVAYIAEAEVR